MLIGYGNIFLQEEKWYSAALKEEVDKITKEKVELEEKCSSLEKENQNLEKESDKKVMAEKENSVKCKYRHYKRFWEIYQ